MTLTEPMNYDIHRYTTSGPTILTPPKVQSYPQTCTETPSGTAWDANFDLKLPHVIVAAQLLDVQCVHAGCCTTSKATRGHYALARAITAVANTIDPTTSREESFGETHRLRPGDGITNAVLDGRRVAIDVGITSQARRSQGDPIQEYANIKLTKYRLTTQHDLLPAGISFRAAIWTQEGRPGTYPTKS